MKTAVVILNWNGIDFLKQFLPTLIEHTQEADIIVIDNQSTDKSVGFLQENFPTVKIIINSENGGYAKGYNDGLQELQGKYEYYLLLNSDIEVTENWLSPLVKVMEENPNIAGVQPKILSFQQKTNFEYAGASGGFIDNNFYPFCRGRIFDTLEEDKGQYDGKTEVFWTTGACMLVRAIVFHELNGFDEDFFAHQEEIDFCWRAKKQNYSFFVEPKSTVFHVGGGTLDYNNPRKTYLNFRNNLFMIHKNYDGILFFKIFHRLVLDGIAGIKFMASFNLKSTFAIIKAHFVYYKNIPTLQQKRKKIKNESSHFNPSGLYKSSILWAYYFQKNKTFDKLNKRHFWE